MTKSFLLKLNNARNILHYEGGYSFIWRIIQYALSHFGTLEMVVFYKKNLDHLIPDFRNRDDLMIEAATNSDIEKLVSLKIRLIHPDKKDVGINTINHIRDSILERFKRGNICFIGKIGTEIVHFNWTFFNSEEWEPKAGFIIRLKNNESYNGDAYTVDEWRGKAIHTFVHNHMLLYLQKNGFKSVYGIVNVENKSSRKTLLRHKWESVGTMLYFMPKDGKRAWKWRVNGELYPFVAD